MIRCGLVVSSLLGLVAAGPAFAVSPVQDATRRFQAEDRCIADARAAHPNRDADSQRQVDEEVDRCLVKHRLPPRAHIAPAEDAPAPPPAG